MLFSLKHIFLLNIFGTYLIWISSLTIAIHYLHSKLNIFPILSFASIHYYLTEILIDLALVILFFINKLLDFTSILIYNFRYFSFTAILISRHKCLFKNSFLILFPSHFGLNPILFGDCINRIELISPFQVFVDCPGTYPVNPAGSKI